MSSSSSFSYDGFCESQWILLKSWAGFNDSPDFWDSTDTNFISNGSVYFGIEPDDQGSPPSSEQFAAYLYLIEHAEGIHEALIQAVIEDYPSRREVYLDCLDDDELHLLPEDISIDHLKTLISLEGVAVLSIVKQSIAYLRFDLKAAWDPEHGFNVTMHKQRAVQVGDTGASDYYAKLDLQLS